MTERRILLIVEGLVKNHGGFATVAGDPDNWMLSLAKLAKLLKLAKLAKLGNVKLMKGDLRIWEFFHANALYRKSSNFQGLLQCGAGHGKR